MGETARERDKFDLSQGNDIKENALSETRYSNIEEGWANAEKHKKMWELLGTYIGHDKESIQKQIINHIEYTGARSRFDFNKQTCSLAVASSLKDRLIECFNDTAQQWKAHDAKRIYVFSPVFSLGKRIQSILINFNLEDAYRESLEEFDIKLEDLYEHEAEEVFSQKGEWATSVLESLATLDLPSMGYGIRYSFNNYSLPSAGFRSNISNPWEIERFDVQ